MKALLIGSVNAAQNALEDGLISSYDQYLTYVPGTAHYCRTQLGIECTDLNSYLTPNQQTETFLHVFPLFTEMLLDLDNINVSVLKGFGSIPELNWFYTFRQDATYGYVGLLLFDSALRRYLATNQINHLTLYDSITPFKPTILSDLRMVILRHVTAAAFVTFEVHHQKPTTIRRAINAALAKSLSRAKRIYTSLKYYAKLIRFILQAHFFAEASPVIFFDHLYELDYLPLGSLHRLSVPFAEFGTHIPAWLSPVKLRLPHQIPSSSIDLQKHSELPYAKQVADVLTNFFRDHIYEYDAALKYTKFLVEKHKIKIAVWGNSPCEISPRSVVIDYLRRLGVCVIGVQHGGNYGTLELYDTVQCQLDYLSCDKFLGYGSINLEAFYIPDTGFQTASMIATGSIKNYAISQISPTTKRLPIDVLFPMNFSCDIFNGDMFPRADLVLERQLRIINFLETCGASVVIKLIKGSLKNRPWNENMFGSFHAIKNLRHCAVNDELTLDEALLHYHPKLVILENLGTPLSDSVFHDVEIILFSDPFRFKPHVRTLVEKRVHLADTFEDFMKLILCFLKGDLPTLRNSEFYETHICPPGNVFDRVLEQLR